MDEDIVKLKRKKRMRTTLIILILLAVVSTFVYYFISNEKKMSSIEFETEKLEKGEIIATVSSTGSLSAVTTVDVGTQVSGKVEEIYVDYNDRVTVGQLLAKIDTATFEAQMQQSEARLKSGEANLAQVAADLDNARINVHNANAGIYQAEAGVSRAKSDLQNAKGALLSMLARIESSKAELENKEAEYKRAKELFQRELISRSEEERIQMLYKMSYANHQSLIAQADSARANVEAAESGVKAAESSLDAAITKKDSAITQVRASEARVSSAQAAIEQAAADLEQVKINLERCLITSPIDGIVIDRIIDVGQTVAASFQTPVLFKLAENLEKMEVKASVDEADIGRVRQNQKVKFTVDAYPEDNFIGEIFQVRTNPTVDQNVVTYDVIIRTDNKDMKLKPGMTANIDITVQVKDNILRLPNTALRFRPDRVQNFPMPEENNKEKDKEKKPETKDEKEEKEETETKEKPETGRKPKPSGDKKGDTKDKPDTVIWVMKDSKPARVNVKLGISDNVYSEIVEGEAKEGMKVITDAFTYREKLAREKQQQQRRRTNIRL